MSKGIVTQVQVLFHPGCAISASQAVNTNVLCNSKVQMSLIKRDINNNNNNNMYLKSSIQTSSIDYIKENIHITLNISSNIPIQ